MKFPPIPEIAPMLHASDDQKKLETASEVGHFSPSWHLRGSNHFAVILTSSEVKEGATFKKQKMPLPPSASAAAARSFSTHVGPPNTTHFRGTSISR